MYVHKICLFANEVAHPLILMLIREPMKQGVYVIKWYQVILLQAETLKLLRQQDSGGQIQKISKKVISN